MGVIPLRSERSASACSATSAIFLVEAILPRLVSLSTFQVQLLDGRIFPDFFTVGMYSQVGTHAIIYTGTPYDSISNRN
jgi:hypothetical protein